MASGIQHSMCRLGLLLLVTMHSRLYLLSHHMEFFWLAAAGCAVLSFDPYQLPAIQPVPLLLATPADLDSPLDSAVSELGPAYDIHM